MKRILALGICALFIACNSSTEKTTETDTNSVVMSDTTPVVSNADTNNITVETAPQTAPAEVSSSPAAKPVEKPVEKPAKVAEVAKAPVAEKPVQAPDNSAEAKKGEALITKSDCFACHKVQEKLLGPAYKDVAAKYANNKANVDYLVAKIKNGGSGVWGAIPMAPHPALSDEDARAMVQYVLSIK